MDGMQACAEDPDLRGNSVPRVRVASRQLTLEPLRDLLAIAPHAEGKYQQAHDNEDQDGAECAHDVDLLVGECFQSSGEQQVRGNDDGYRGDVEDAFDCPDRELRCEGKTGSAG